MAGLGKPDSPEAEAAAQLATTLEEAGFEVLLDDRAGGAEVSGEAGQLGRGPVAERVGSGRVAVQMHEKRNAHGNLATCHACTYR